MENLNLHKQKLYAVIVAAVGLLAMFLPWWRVSFGGYGGLGGGGYSINGMHEIGLLAFVGFVAAGIVTFVMGDRSKPYDGQVKMIAAASFGLAALIAIIQFARQSKFTSFGLYLAIIAGVAGAVIVYMMKPEQFGASKPPTPPTA